MMADGKLDSLMDVTLGAFQALKAKNPNVVAWQSALAVRLAGSLLPHLRVQHFCRALERS